MSIFDRFRRKPPEMEHPLYGRIVYACENTWEGGRIHFKPLAKDVEVIITAGPNGPNASHASFLSELEARWPSLVKEWDPLLRSALVDWIEEPGREDIMSRLTVETIDLYERLAPDQEWEFQFWCEEASHWPTIAMKGWTPQSCFVDG